MEKHHLAQANYKNKIKKVFFSINDPDFRSYNKSSKLLKKKNKS